MKMKKWQTSVLVCASLLCLSACKNQSANQADNQSGDKQGQVSSQTAKQGEEVPDFELMGVDGKTYNSYEDLKRAFAEAVDKDSATLSNGSVKFDNTVSLKEKLFKKLLQQTDSFKTSIFK